LSDEKAVNEADFWSKVPDAIREYELGDTGCMSEAVIRAGDVFHPDTLKMKLGQIGDRFRQLTKNMQTGEDGTVSASTITKEQRKVDRESTGKRASKHIRVPGMMYMEGRGYANSEYLQITIYVEPYVQGDATKTNVEPGTIRVDALTRAVPRCYNKRVGRRNALTVEAEQIARTRTLVVGDKVDKNFLDRLIASTKEKAAKMFPQHESSMEYVRLKSQSKDSKN
jgi:hypothetical protein